MGSNNSFVCNRYPREMLKHLRELYGISTEKREQGIYYLKESRFPVQIIINHELNPKKNLWLYSLRGNLTEEEIEEVLKDYQKHKKEKNYQSAMDLIIRANWRKIKEEKKMCEALEELFAEELEEREQRGEQRGMRIGEHNKIISLIKRKLARGKTEEVIADELEEEVPVIHELIAEVMQAAN